MKQELDVSFFDGLEGAGLENITSTEQVVPYLGMVQPDSQAAADGAQVGTWRNSATGETYGNLVAVVVLGFRTVWVERDSQPPFTTVGRYMPHSINVTVQQPKNGRGYPKMVNPETGNEIKELYMYALMLPEHPEAGVLLFNPSVSSMRACKSWNTQLKSQILPNGKQAPIFAYTWDLALDIVDNQTVKGKKITQLVKVQKSSIIGKELFDAYINPQLPTINSSVLAITAAPEIEEE